MIHARNSSEKGNTTTFSNEFKKKGKEKKILFSLNQSQPLLWLTPIWERECLTYKKKRKLRPVQAERSFVYLIEKQSFIRLCKWAPLFSRCWMASNNETVISLKGKLLRVTQCSIRHPVTRLLPSPRPGSHTRWEKPPGRRVITCCIIGFIQNDLWIFTLSRMDLWFSSLV